MKKIISLVIAFTLILSSFPFALTYGAGYETPDSFAEMEGVLRAFKIIDEEFTVSKRELTRAEFTAMIIKAAGLGDFVGSVSDGYSFSDVPSDHIYFPYIKMAKEKGLSLGYSDGSFKPEDTVTFMEAIVYMIRLLGYTDMAEAQNGYPGGYFFTASNIGLLKNINIATETVVTDEIAINLIFNALNTNILGQEYYSKDGTSVSLVEGEPLMYQSFKARKVTGVVDEIDLSALVGPNDLNPYSISVGKVNIDIGKLMPNDLLGYNVNAYYVEEETKNVLKFICEQRGRNSIEEVDIIDITSISDYKVRYTNEKGKAVELKYERGAAIIYNGVSTKSAFNMAILNDLGGNKLDGKVRLLDNDADGIADVVYIDAYEEIVVGKKANGTNTIYDKKNPSKKEVLDNTVNDPYTIIYNEQGEEITFGKIKEGATVAIYKSKPDAYQGYIRAYVSENTVTGTLMTLNDDGVTKTVEIDGSLYDLTVYGAKYFDSTLMGRQVRALVNKFGKITLIEKAQSSSEKWGMVKTIIDPKGDISYARFVILTEDGTMKEFYPAKNLKVDGRSPYYKLDYESDITAIKAILESAAKKTESRPQGSKRYNTMVRYRLNSDGKINMIDTVLNSLGAQATKNTMQPDDMLYLQRSEDNATCVITGEIRMIGSRIAFDEITPVFLYPISANDDSYGVTVSGNVFSNGIKYNADANRHTMFAYYIDKESTLPDLFIHPSIGIGAYKTASSGFMTMVKKVTSTVDDEGQPKVKVYALTNNNAQTFLCDPDLASIGEISVKAKDLKPGDILYLAISSYDNSIESFQIRYLVSTDKVYNNIAYKNDNTTNRSQFATLVYPYKANNEGMQYVVSYDGIPVDDNGTLVKYKISDIENVYNGVSGGTVAGYRSLNFNDRLPITVYDSSKKGDNMVYAGGINDIITYTEAGADLTKVVIHTYNYVYHLPRAIFVIK